MPRSLLPTQCAIEKSSLDIQKMNFTTKLSVYTLNITKLFVFLHDTCSGKREANIRLLPRILNVDTKRNIEKK